LSAFKASGFEQTETGSGADISNNVIRRITAYKKINGQYFAIHTKLRNHDRPTLYCVHIFYSKDRLGYLAVTQRNHGDSGKPSHAFQLFLKDPESFFYRNSINTSKRFWGFFLHINNIN
jgi:hypothetical protein